MGLYVVEVYGEIWSSKIFCPMVFYLNRYQNFKLFTTEQFGVFLGGRGSIPLATREKHYKCYYTQNLIVFNHVSLRTVNKLN